MPSAPLLQLQDTLRQHHMSLTTARRTVFTALQGKEPLTMHELVSVCAAIDRASVYRTVQLFELLGIVQKLQTGWKYKLELSSDFHDHHHHATCVRCGSTTVLPENTALEQNLAALANSKSFYTIRHQLELQGYCETCYVTSDSTKKSPVFRAF